MTDRIGRIDSHTPLCGARGEDDLLEVAYAILSGTKLKERT